MARLQAEIKLRFSYTFCTTTSVEITKLIPYRVRRVNHYGGIYCDNCINGITTEGGPQQKIERIETIIAELNTPIKFLIY
jgi:hypothetical protein